MKFNIDTEALLHYVNIYAINVVSALAILLIGKWVARILTGLFRKLLVKSKVDETLVSFGGNVAYALLLAFVAVAALNRLGVETTSLAAAIAAAGLAIGLALQGSLSNLAAGVMIIAFRPFRIGDYIEAGGTAGSVADISIFTTTFRTPDNKTVIVPNSQITGGNITNYSAQRERRIDMVFGIGYGDDIRKAKDVLERILAEEPRVLKVPAPVIAVLSLGDSSVNLAVRPWVKTQDYWDAHFAITEKVKLRFDEEGITIPFPQRDIHLYAVDKTADKPVKNAA